MKRSLQFLSGFNLGRILADALEKQLPPKEIMGEQYKHYADSWARFSNDKEFEDGLRVGIMLNDLPKLNADLDSWFASIN